VKDKGDKQQEATVTSQRGNGSL